MPGLPPNSQTGDYTDVVVRSPYGEISRAPETTRCARDLH
jgi:hypothetical protein